MRVVMCGALLVLLMTTPLSAQEEEFSANNLLEGCRRFLNTELSGPPLELLKDGQCIGSIGAVVYFAKVLTPKARSCVPVAIDRGQVIRTVIAYIEARPQRMHEDLRALTVDALRSTWPCKK
jgi:hypothetical protein